MADNESTSVTKDLGIVSAYGYAKAAGYTGTEEEFEQIFLEFTENAPGLLDRLDDAVDAAEDAESTAVSAKNTAVDAKDAAVAAAATFETDTTLAVSGKAADAKVTGDNFTQLSTALSQYDGIVKTAFINKSGKKIINGSGVIISASGTYYVTEPITVSKGDRVSFTAVGNSANFTIIATCNSDSTNIVPKVKPTSTTLKEYIYDVEADGYVILSYNYSYSATLYILKNYSNQKLDVKIQNNTDNLTVVNALLKEQKNLKSQYSAVGSYIALNGAIGSTVDVNNPGSAQGYAYIVYPCRFGDVFVLSGVGGSASRAWGFTDSDYKLLSRANADATVNNLTLTSTQDGYFISNVNTNYGYSLSGNLFYKPATDGYVNAEIDKYFPASNYRKNFQFIAGDLNTYIHVNHGNFDLFTSETTAAQVTSAFNTLASGSNGYMVATSLGLASDGTTTMYSYTLQPITGYTGLTLYIISGQHGFEKSSIFGLYYFFRELIENYKGNPSLEYFRNWCKIICIPLMNPYGFDNMSYTNSNGVNLNRNWATPWWTAGSGTNYGGAEPADQVETQYAQAIMDENADDIFWFVDFHTQGSEPVASYSSLIWNALGTTISQDNYTKIGISAAKKLVNEMSSRFCLDYPEDCPTYTQCGYYDQSFELDHSGRSNAYARYIGVQGECFEGFAAFPNGAKYKPTCHQANADAIANWIRCLIMAYEREGGYNN